MVLVDYRFKVVGLHTWNGYKLRGSGICAHSQTSPTVLEDLGTSTHTTTHEYTGQIDIAVGDRMAFSSWIFGIAWPHEVYLYLNGRMVGSDTSNAQCNTVDYTATEQDFKKGGRGTPLYMEQLHKLEQKTTRVVYDPLTRNRKSIRA